MLPDVPSTRPLRSISFAVLSTASWPSGTLLMTGAHGSLLGSCRSSSAHVLVIRTSGLTILSGTSPARRRSRSSATIWAPRASVSVVAPPMCGVSTTLSMDKSGCPAGSTSPLKVVKTGAAKVPAT